MQDKNNVHTHMLNIDEVSTTLEKEFNRFSQKKSLLSQNKTGEISLI